MSDDRTPAVDITPIVNFDLRPSYEELTTPIDDEIDADVWRQIAHAALDEASRLRVLVDRQNDRIRALICGETHDGEAE